MTTVWIQFLLVAAVIVVGGFFMRRTGADSHLAIRRILYALFVVVAILAIVFPGITSTVANMVGVGRGADLLLYGLAIAFFATVYTSYRRNTQMQRKLTLLSRRIALDEAVRREHGGQN